MNAHAKTDDEVADDERRNLASLEAPYDENTAFEELTELFGSDDWVHSENPQYVQRAVDILLAFPTLARRTFYFSGPLDKTSTWKKPLVFLPIHHVLFAKGTSLLAVQSVLNMFPGAALCPKGKFPRKPPLALHVACASENGSSKEIITYLLDKGGTTSVEMRFRGLRPIDYFVQRLVLVPSSGGDEVQELLMTFDFLWGTLSSSEQLRGRHSMLTLGISHGCIPFILHLSQKPNFLIPKALNISFEEDRDFQRAAAMTLLLPHLKVLEFSWGIPCSTDGFRHLMHSLAMNTSIRELSLMLPDEIKKSDIRALEYFIGANKFICDLSIATEYCNPDETDGQLVESIIRGLRQNQSLTSLNLTGFEIVIGALATILEVSPKRLDLAFCVFEDGDNDPAQVQQSFFRLEDLRVDMCYFDGSTLATFVSRLNKHCLLKYLYIDDPDFEEQPAPDLGSLTRGFILILERNHLRSLEIRNIGLEMVSFCQALGRSTSLESLSLHNVPYEAIVEAPVNMELTRGVLSLMKQKQFCSLEIRKSRLDMVPFCKELEQNTSLKCLNLEIFPGGPEDAMCLARILEHHNRTVSVVCVSKDLTMSTTDHDAVGYYSLLNRFGRKEMSNHDLNPSIFVDLVSRAINLGNVVGDDCLGPVHDWVPEPLANVTYGLLQELPSLWSGFALQSRF